MGARAHTRGMQSSVEYLELEEYVPMKNTSESKRPRIGKFPEGATPESRAEFSLPDQEPSEPDGGPHRGALMRGARAAPPFAASPDTCSLSAVVEIHSDLRGEVLILFLET